MKTFLPQQGPNNEHNNDYFNDLCHQQLIASDLRTQDLILPACIILSEVLRLVVNDSLSSVNIVVGLTAMLLEKWGCLTVYLGNAATSLI